MLKARSKAAGHRITAGEDKACDTADHVTTLRAMKVTPHVTRNNGVTKTGTARKSTIDERTTRHQGYGMSQSRRASDAAQRRRLRSSSKGVIAFQRFRIVLMSEALITRRFYRR
jgi:hypothetical protein